MRAENTAPCTFTNTAFTNSPQRFYRVLYRPLPRRFDVKRSLQIVAMLACALAAQAQGTLQFHAALTGSDEVPPNTDPTIGTGTFSLTGNSLSFLVDVPATTFISVSGYIQGPASPGANAGIIFDLGGPVFRPGNDFGTPPGYRFSSPFDGTFGAGPFALTDAQINDLESGVWYVNITSAMHPDGQLRGQILAVPEPSVLALLGLGVGAFVWQCRRRA